MLPSDQMTFRETQSTGLQLMLFCTSWSTPCRQQWEILDKFCLEPGGKNMQIVRIDIDRSPEFADKWTIQTIPTTLLVDGNREIDRFIGLLSPDRLKGIVGGCLAET
jgi:thioredoxin-like negative regulator of GroEL